MSERYEITDDGKLIRIGCPDGCMETLRPTEPDVGVYLDDIVIAAIRQQQADLAALKELLAGEVEANEAFRKAGGALDGEDMPTFCARLISENSGMREEIAGIWSVVRDMRSEIAALTTERDQLRARLAAIDSAPVVAVVHEINRDFASGPYRCLGYDSDKLPAGGNELIAKPAKD